MRKQTRMIAALLLCGMLPFSGCSAKKNEGKVSLYCLNIGKADCMILSFENKNFLIDTGHAHTFIALKTALESLNIDHLDGVFISHCHQDHVGGLLPLVKSAVAIDHIYASDIYFDVKEKKHPVSIAAKDAKMDVEWLRAGDEVRLENGYSFQIIGPLRVNEENENNNSLVLYFTSPHGTVLFAGDMKEDEENDLISNKTLQHCDVLKCAHHGDDGATSAAFLRAVTPRYAVISTHSGEEADTPAPKTLSNLRAVGCEVYVTQDAQNAYCIEMQNGNISVQDIVWHGIPQKIQGIQMKMDTKDDLIILKTNGNETISISDAFLYSCKGEEVFALPDFALSPGEEYLIGSRDTKKDVSYVLPGKEIWHNKKLDIAILYDAFGRILSTCDNGKKEE